MKKILLVLFALYLLVPSGFGQDDEILPKSLGVSFFLNDFATASRIRTTSLSTVLRNKSVAKLREMSPGLAITYYKGIKKHLDMSASLGGSFVDYPMPNKAFASNNFLLEANASVIMKMTSEKYWFQPFLTAGIGGHKYLGYYGAFMPLGGGIKLNIMNETQVFLTSTYRVPITTETANYHFQHSLTIAGRLTKKKEPVVIPPPPPPPPVDTDGDGIIDSEDKCPTVKGVAKYQGCPIPDTDGDGINDEEDKCPNLKGTAANYGCPEITEEIKKKVEVAAKNILFVTGSAKLRPQSFVKLADVITIMKDNPDMLLAIDGHTDSDGSEEMNQTLSENRANAVKNYLIEKGIAESRITATGHGELEPIATNKTAAGKTQNRRSELTLSYFK